MMQSLRFTRTKTRLDPKKLLSILAIASFSSELRYANEEIRKNRKRLKSV